MSVNDKWHYCHNCEVLVGSRAMRDRHLRLLGYIILQVSYSRLTYDFYTHNLRATKTHQTNELVMLIKHKDETESMTFC